MTRKVTAIVLLNLSIVCSAFAQTSTFIFKAPGDPKATVTAFSFDGTYIYASTVRSVTDAAGNTTYLNGTVIRFQ